MQTHLEKLRTESANCETIAKLAEGKVKPELITRLAQHYRVLASEVEVWHEACFYATRAVKQNEPG
jgi:hypothetical protein